MKKCGGLFEQENNSEHQDTKELSTKNELKIMTIIITIITIIIITANDEKSTDMFMGTTRSLCISL